MTQPCDRDGILLPQFSHRTLFSLAQNVNPNNICNRTTECPSGWSGHSDIIDFAGLVCQRHTLSMQIIWFSVVVCLIATFIKMVRATRSQLAYFKRRAARHRKSGKTIHWYLHKPVVILGLGAFSVAMIFLFALPRSLNALDHAFVGINLYPSISYSVGFAAFFGGSSLFIYTSTETALGSLQSTGVMPAGKLNAIMSSFSKYLKLGLCSYIAGKVLVLVLQSTGQSIVVEVLVLNNLSVVIQCAILAYASNRMVKEVNNMVSMVPRTQDLGSGKLQVDSTPVENKMAKALDRLLKSASESLRTSFIGMSLYTIMSVPMFWPFQELLLVLATFIVIINAHKVVRLFGKESTKKRSWFKFSSITKSSGKILPISSNLKRATQSENTSESNADI